MSFLLDGTTLAATIRADVKKHIEADHLQLGLAVLLVGDDPASHLYVSLKRKACEEAGMRFELTTYPKDEPEANLIEKIKELNQRDDVTGILVQLPLPSQNADRVIAAIDPRKDVDGFHPKNLEHLEAGEPGIAPALELGIMKLMDHGLLQLGKQTEPGLTCVIIGSSLFARPMMHFLKERGILAQRVSADDPHLPETSVQADILIVAVGKPGVVTGDMIKPQAVVIDVGTTRIGGKVFGDVETESAKKIAGAITPVPGGVGPMTVAMLLLNILKAHELQA